MPKYPITTSRKYQSTKCNSRTAKCASEMKLKQDVQFHNLANLHFIPIHKPPGDICPKLSWSRFYGHEF